MKQTSISFSLLILLSSCYNLSGKEKDFSNEFSLYLKNTFDFQIQQNKTHLLVLNVDCFSCNEQFVVDFSKQKTIPDLVPIICGIEGSEIIEQSLLKIKRNYPNYLIDRHRKVDRYRISESGKNILVEYYKSEPSRYWDLGSGKYTNPTNGKILLSSIISGE